MPLVTALRATRHGGVALHVDEEYVCVVSESLVARWRLFEGRELSAHDIAQIRAASSAERVLGDAYRLLGHRARSTKELRDRLIAKEHDEAVVAKVLDRLTADGFLDDAAFARSYVADKRRLEGWGQQRIRRGLRALGVESGIVDEALAEDALGVGGELDRALAVLRRRGAPEQPFESARRRAFQALQRKGFSTGVAYAAVRIWLEHEPPPAN